VRVRPISQVVRLARRFARLRGSRELAGTRPVSRHGGPAAVGRAIYTDSTVPDLAFRVSAGDGDTATDRDGSRQAGVTYTGTGASAKRYIIIGLRTLSPA